MSDQSISQVSTSIAAAESYSRRANPAFEAEFVLRTASHRLPFPQGAPSMRPLPMRC